MGQQRFVPLGTGQRQVLGTPAPAQQPAVYAPPPPGTLGGLSRQVQQQRMGGPLPSRQMGQQPMPIELMQRLMLLQQMQGPEGQE